MNNSEAVELEQMANQMKQAAEMLRKVNAALEKTKPYRDVEPELMDKLIEAQEELETAVSLFQAIHEEWIEAARLP